jgi:ubiquinol oxidase
MESLGGDQAWFVRFLAQHSALVYFIVLCHLWAISPTLSYRFSELLETHAVNTYGQFLDENEPMLKTLPPSLSAIEYYSFGSSDPYYTEFQTTALANGAEFRRPGEDMSSLHDVFNAIRDDESDHVSTMDACLDPNASIQSPSMEKRILTGVALVSVVGTFALSSGDVDLSSLSDMMFDGADGDILVEGGSVTTAIFDSVLAGMAGFAQLVTNDEQAGDVAGMGADMLEAGAARRAVVSFLTALAEFAAALL